MRVAVLIPCFNEELTVAQTIGDYRGQFPNASIYVCDNASTDATRLRAKESGAFVIYEPRRGKGFAVRRLFQEVEADFYVMTDGDHTYSAKDAERLLETVKSKSVDMAVGDRLSSGEYSRGTVRPFHQNGNHAVSKLISLFFRTRVADPLSGLRVFSRKFVKTVPLISQGFEIETELTLQAIDKGFVIGEIPASYADRPKGNPSKLRTFSDGSRIILTFLQFALYFRPLTMTLSLSWMLFVAFAILGFDPVREYFIYEYVYKVPSLVVATGCLILSLVCFFVGFILESMRYSRTENFLLRLKDVEARESI